MRESEHDIAVPVSEVPDHPVTNNGWAFVTSREFPCAIKVNTGGASVVDSLRTGGRMANPKIR